MRVQVVYNFYFDYVLPRLDHGQALSFDVRFNDGDPVKQYDAFVRGRDHDDPLFYADIGATLSGGELPLRPVDRPEEGLVYRVRDRVVDRLLVALEWDTDTSPAEDPSSVDLWQERAAFVASTVLSHLRVIARSPRVQVIQRRWHASTQRFTISQPPHPGMV